MTASDTDEEGWAAALATALVSSQSVSPPTARRLQQAFVPRAGESVGTLRCAPGDEGQRRRAARPVTAE